MKVDSLYICPWSFNDALCQSQSFSYVEKLTEFGYTFAFLTLENKHINELSEDHKQITELLKSKGIYWYPVYWKSGNSIADKLFSIFWSFIIGLKICFRHQPRLIHSRSSLTAFLAVLISKTFRKPLLYDADSLLSEEYADTNHLSKDSLGFKFLAWSEKAARRRASQIIVLTEKLKADYQTRFKIDKPIEVIPCCVNTENFRFNENHRADKRKELGLTDELVFVYVGKHGSWYLVEETIDFFRIVLENNSSAKLLIITKDKAEVFTNLFNAKNIPDSSYFIRSAEPTEVTRWLSASDVGLAFIRPLPSKRGSSPVKTSEYLANGLPIISNLGIGDLDTIIENEQVGAVLRKFDKTEYTKALETINNLRRTDNLREKCRQAADRHFNLVTVGGFRYRNLYQTLLKK